MSLLSRRLTTFSRASPISHLSALHSQFATPPRARTPLLLRTMASSQQPPLPKTMKGIIIEKTGGVEVLQYKTDLPVPTPQDGQILVKNDFIGINYIDTYFRTGLYPAPSFPYTLGREAAGTILAIGPGETYSLNPADRVVYMGTSAYAEYTAVPALHAYKIPASIPSDTAAAVLLQGLTALTLMRESHPVKAGEWILVHAAAGGVGLLLCQLLKAVGARTIATASTEEKREKATRAGAEVTVDYTKEDVVERVKAVTGGKGVSAVFDGVGRDTFDVSLASLARKGSLVSFGNASGPPAPVVVARLSQGNVRLLRPTLFGYVVTREEFVGYVRELLGFVEEGALDVRVHEVYPLEEVARAHGDLEGRRTSGKLLLKV